MSTIEWKRYREYVIGGLTLVFLAVFWHLAIGPLCLENQDIMDEIQSAGVNVDVAGTEVARLSLFRSQSQEIRARVDELSVTASPDDPVRWVKELEQLAVETGNRIRIESDDALVPKKVSPGKGVPNTQETEQASAPATLAEGLPSDQSVGVRILLDGDYQSITLFLKKLELFHEYVDVLSFKLTKNIVESSTVQVAASDQSPGVGASMLQGSGAISSGVGIKSPQSPMSAVLESVVYTTKQ